MPRPVALVELGMEAQQGIHGIRRACAPLYEAALASGDEAVIDKTEALSTTLWVAELQAKQLTGLAQRIETRGRRDAA